MKLALERVIDVAAAIGAHETADAAREELKNARDIHAKYMDARRSLESALSERNDLRARAARAEAKEREVIDAMSAIVSRASEVDTKVAKLPRLLEAIKAGRDVISAIPF